MSDPDYFLFQALSRATSGIDEKDVPHDDDIEQISDPRPSASGSQGTQGQQSESLQDRKQRHLNELISSIENPVPRPEPSRRPISLPSSPRRPFDPFDIRPITSPPRSLTSTPTFQSIIPEPFRAQDRRQAFKNYGLPDEVRPPARDASQEQMVPTPETENPGAPEDEVLEDISIGASAFGSTNQLVPPAPSERQNPVDANIDVVMDEADDTAALINNNNRHIQGFGTHSNHN